MRSVVIQAFGDPQAVLDLAERPRPEPSRRHRSGKIALAATMGGRPTHHRAAEDAPP